MIDQIEALRELGSVEQQSIDLVTLRARAAIGPVARRMPQASWTGRASTRARGALVSALVLVLAGALLLVARPWGSGSADAALLPP